MKTKEIVTTKCKLDGKIYTIKWVKNDEYQSKNLSVDKIRKIIKNNSIKK